MDWIEKALGKKKTPNSRNGGRKKGRAPRKPKEVQRQSPGPQISGKGA